jgi:hypothetical protein
MYQLQRPTNTQIYTYPLQGTVSQYLKPHSVKNKHQVINFPGIRWTTNVFSIHLTTNVITKNLHVYFSQQTLSSHTFSKWCSNQILRPLYEYLVWKNIRTTFKNFAIFVSPSYAHNHHGENNMLITEYQNIWENFLHHKR